MMKLECFRISNGALAAQDLPKRLRLLAWGDNPATKQRNVRIGAHTLARFAANMEAAGLDKVAIDFEHNTTPGTRAYAESAEPREVAGYGVPIVIEGDGLFLDAIEWTPAGAKHARNYIDLSPTVHFDRATGEVDLLHSVALTRAGAVEGLQFYNAEGDAPMEDWKKFLLSMLDLPEDTADDALRDALLDRMAKPANDAMTALGARLDVLEAAKPEGDAEALEALSASVQSLSGKLTAMEAALEQFQRNELVLQAAREGKVVPLSAEQLAATPLATLREMVGKLPVSVPLDQRTDPRVAAFSADAAPDASTLSRVARACGIDPATVK